MAGDLSTLERVLDALDEHESRVAACINMVPSENSFSSVAKLPMLLDVYHRYFFNVAESPEGWHFRGVQDVAELETRFTQPLLRELARAAYINLRPLSGLSAMALVLSSL